MESLFSDVRWRLYYGWVEVNFSLGSTTYSDVGGVGAGAFPLLIEGMLLPYLLVFGGDCLL